MGLEIYNTLSGRKEKFAPLEGKRVRMYVCGITPYDKSHLGHARTIVAFDMMRSYLSSRGFHVTFVQNITDIDDKIIRRARERKMLPLELAAKYTKESEGEFAALGVRTPDFAPRVSEFIPQIISLIQGIEKKGFAYVTETGVCFDVAKFKPYGKLSRQDMEMIKAGARIEVDEGKRNPQDFALWKLGSEPGATFGSPWGEGRPGWHIECSAMATSILGNTIDIHGGARDLIFPHHENEIAQSEAATGKLFVKYWVHTGFLTVKGEKMAKSLGNFITIEDGLKKHKPQALRLLFILTHYRSPMDYSDEAAAAAQNSLDTLQSAALAARSYASKGNGTGILAEAAETEKKFHAAMDDDFDTPAAMASLFSLAKRMNGACSEGSAQEEEVKEAGEKLDGLLSMLGLEPKEEKGKIGEKEVEKLIKERDEARKRKDFAASDEIRKGLAEKGVILEDRTDGSTSWRRKT